jgi:pectinesterase
MKYHTLVDVHYQGIEGALNNTVKTYRTLCRALEDSLEDAPEFQNKPYIIFIRNGRYYEKPVINKPYIMLLGEDKERTILTYDMAQGSKRADGSPWNNLCATLNINAPCFSAENLTIENSFDHPANFLKTPDDPTRINDAQALAVRTGKGSDRAFFKNCRLLGFQDTLFADSGTQYYLDCYLAGHVDFIYGGGQAVFDHCTIVTRHRRYVTPGEPIGYIAAPCTQKTKEYGLIFFNCRLLRETPDIPDHSTHLGRPWHPTIDWPDGARAADPDAIGNAVYINCFMDDHISPKGWDKMRGRDKAGNPIWFHPDTDARFYEYGSTGPGAIQSPSRKVLTGTEIKKYTIEKILNGWNPLSSLKELR